MKKDFLKSLTGLIVLFLGFAIYVMLMSSCGGGGGGSASTNTTTQTVDENQAKFLKSISENVLLAAIDDFSSKLDALKNSVELLEADLSSNGGNSSTLTTNAKNAWVEAMLAWEVLEMLQIGPIGSKTTTEGGEGFRDELYSWPTSSPCAIDQELVKNVFTGSGYLDSKLINVYGLDALEYLLFTTSFENECASLVDINTNGTWDALDESTITLRRAQYALVIVENLVSDTSALKTALEDFSLNLKNAGVDKTVFKTTQEAVDAVFAGVFYLDSKVKDKKLALPFGLGSNASSGLQGSELEFNFKDLNKDAVIANLNTFKLVFQGGNGNDTSHYGLDDLLIAKNATDTANDILSKFDEVLAAAEALPEFQSIIDSSNTTEVSSFYNKLKELTTLIKTDLVLVLKLEIPSEGAGDND